MARSFTLVELVMVLAIMVTLSAIAAPRYARSLARFRVDSAAQRIMADLALASRLARESSASQSVVFWHMFDLYQLTGVPDINNPGQTYTVNLDREPYKADIFSANFGGNGSVVFDGFGEPDTGGTVVIKVGNQQRTITMGTHIGTLSVN